MVYLRELWYVVSSEINCRPYFLMRFKQRMIFKIIDCALAKNKVGIIKVGVAFFKLSCSVLLRFTHCVPCCPKMSINSSGRRISAVSNNTYHRGTVGITAYFIMTSCLRGDLAPGTC